MALYSQLSAFQGLNFDSSEALLNRLLRDRRFDRAFANELSARYATAPDLLDDLEKALEQPKEGAENLEGLVARVDDIAVSRNLPAMRERRERLRRLMTHVQRGVEHFASSRGLERWQTGYSVHAVTDEEWAESMLGVSDDARRQPTYSTYRIEPRGPNEYVLLVNGGEVWRGESADQALSDATTMAAASQFLSDQSD